MIDKLIKFPISSPSFIHSYRNVGKLQSLKTSSPPLQSENVNRLYPTYLFGGLREITYEKQQAQ